MRGAGLNHDVLQLLRRILVVPFEDPAPGLHGSDDSNIDHASVLGAQTAQRLA